VAAVTNTNVHMWV